MINVQKSGSIESGRTRVTKHFIFYLFFRFISTLHRIVITSGIFPCNAEMLDRKNDHKVICCSNRLSYCRFFFLCWEKPMTWMLNCIFNTRSRAILCGLCLNLWIICSQCMLFLSLLPQPISFFLQFNSIAWCFTHNRKMKKYAIGIQMDDFFFDFGQQTKNSSYFSTKYTGTITLQFRKMTRKKILLNTQIEFISCGRPTWVNSSKENSKLQSNWIIKSSACTMVRVMQFCMYTAIIWTWNVWCNNFVSNNLNIFKMSQTTKIMSTPLHLIKSDPLAYSWKYINTHSMFRVVEKFLVQRFNRKINMKIS